MEGNSQEERKEGKNGCFLHEMKAAILAHYDKKKITMPITDQFNNDFKSGRVRIKMDDASVVIE